MLIFEKFYNAYFTQLSHSHTLSHTSTVKAAAATRFHNSNKELNEKAKRHTYISIYISTVSDFCDTFPPIGSDTLHGLGVLLMFLLLF